MSTILVSVLVLVFIGFLLLGYISPYEGDINVISFDIIEEKPTVNDVVENQIPVEIHKEESLNNFNQELLPLNEDNVSLKDGNKLAWRNIGLELYNENNLDHFIEKINSIIGKKVLVITDSNYVLGANFKGHKKYEGILSKYEILEGRYPYQPIVKFTVDVPVLDNTTVNLNWIYDRYRFDDDFSSYVLVEEFLRTGTSGNELFLVEA